MAQEASPEKQRLPGPQKIRRVGERKHISEITLDKMIGLKKKKQLHVQPFTSRRQNVDLSYQILRRILEN